MDKRRKVCKTLLIKQPIQSYKVRFTIEKLKLGGKIETRAKNKNNYI